MRNSEKILVIANNENFKLKEKGSQFIGLSFKVENENGAEKKLVRIRKEYYDATHHCYAYKINPNIEKYSDDGEPNGTAGIRILNAINHFELTNILIVVIRYFGGTKLGVGPLGKAYGDTALNLLHSSQIDELTKFQKISINFSYDDISSIHYLLNKFNCQKIENIYNETPSIDCLIEPYFLTKFESNLIEKTNGKARLEAKNATLYLRLK